jgi:hypothetical protein
MRIVVPYCVVAAVKVSNVMVKVPPMVSAQLFDITPEVSNVHDGVPKFIAVPI